MTIVNKKFGHTKYTHNLFKHSELPSDYRYLIEKQNKEQIKKFLKKGMIVTFNVWREREINGRNS